MFFRSAVGLGTIILLIAALLLVLSFEFVNGFNDTANAVATVIYTRTPTPTQAVVWSGAWNFLGVLTSSGAVAFGIVTLLSVELILDVESGAGFAMVFARRHLVSWHRPRTRRLDRRRRLMNSLVSGAQQFGESVNWAERAGHRAGAGHLAAGRLRRCGPAAAAGSHGRDQKSVTLPVARRRDASALDSRPAGADLHQRERRAGLERRPEGMGLIMLILIGVMPATYALNLSTSPNRIQSITAASPAADSMANAVADGELSRLLTSGNPTPHTP